MSDVDGTCEYVLDPNNGERWVIPDDPETFDNDICRIREEDLNEKGVWSCPHDVENDKDLCVFHLPVEKKSDEEVVTAFFDALETANESDDPNIQKRKKQFFDANFGTFDIEGRPVITEGENDRIDFTHANFNGRVYFSDSDIDADVLFLDATFEKGGDFERTTFTKHTSFGGEQAGAEFKKDVNFNRANFNEVANFQNVTFSGNASFEWANFSQNIYFGGAVFKETANFKDIRCEGETKFWDVKFNEVMFRNAKFNGETNFSQAEFGHYIIFSETEFNDGVDFDEVNLQDARLWKANLTDASFVRTNLQGANLESALLSRATLFGADLRGAKLSGTVLGDIRINDSTKFLGNPLNEEFSPHTIDAIRSRPCCVYDPSYDDERKRKEESSSKEDSSFRIKLEDEDVDKAKSVYRALEELGSKHARPRLQARCFVRRQDLQKDEYKRVMLGREGENDKEEESSSLEERLIAGARWSRAKVARATLLYGESPWRVISWSLGIILSFALLYPLGGWMKPADGDPITYAQIASNPVEILNSVYYSTLTYTALGFGDFQPVGLGRLLTTVETGLGAVMLALLVFILGRRAAR